MESAITLYQQRQNAVISSISSEVEVCLAADETFFEGVILVMLDLPSGYIFVEEITENCQYETWQQRVSQIFQPLGLKVKYLVSDRAKAIIKLALNDLGTNSITIQLKLPSWLNNRLKIFKALFKISIQLIDYKILVMVLESSKLKFNLYRQSLIFGGLGLMNV
jgi:hypothetical protein